MGLASRPDATTRQEKRTEGIECNDWFGADTANPLRLEPETIAATGLYSEVIARAYDRLGITLAGGRDVSLQVGVTNDLDQDYAVALR